MVFSKTNKKIEKIHTDSEKSISSFELKKKNNLPDYLLDNYYFLTNLLNKSNFLLRMSYIFN